MPGKSTSDYKNFLYFPDRVMFGTGVSAAWSPQRRSRLMRSRTHSSNLHVIWSWSALPLGSAVGLYVSVRCSEAVRSHVDGWVSCELQLCCRTATKKAESEPATLINFLVGCAASAASSCAAYNISTEPERDTGYCFVLLRFCPLHCDASDVYCCCCSWLLLCLSSTLRCFGYGR